MASSSSSSSTWTMEKASGSHLFKIAGYSLAKGMGVGYPIRSAPFTVGGYDWVVECFLSGEEEAYADYIAIVLTLESDAANNNVQVSYTVNLLDQPGAPRRPKSSVDVFSDHNSSYGWPKFMLRADLEKSQYLKNDSLTIYCAVSVAEAPRLQVDNADAVAPPPPPSDLAQHLGRLLESGEGTDVVFEVGGETFAAHRCVLAARSPVFRAELFGSMEEGRAGRIKLGDMEAAVFKALLHFIYSDTLPSNAEEPTKESSSNSMAQHLLVAADRYGLERLKLICEDRLCREMEIDTVANTLALAEQHQCGRLKAVCLDFVASPGVLAAVIETGGFEHLRISCPLVMKELLKKISSVTDELRSSKKRKVAKRS